MKILITGQHGQVSRELQQRLQGLGELIVLGRDQLDLADAEQIRQHVRAQRPDLIINAAAHTAVDLAESEPDAAFAINAIAPGVLAEEAKALGIPLIHYSTDYVFDGSKPAPYTEADTPNPLGVYGQSKLAGEQAIAAVGGEYLILRTSWVYANHGKNFLLTMLRLAKERDELRVVADQHGAPTWSRTIADTTAQVLSQAHAGGNAWWDQHSGIYHLSAQGQTTWHEFTQAIVEEAGLSCKVLPITSADYPTPAQWPQFSVMSSERLMTRFCHLPDWKTALQLCMR
ncbi:MAG TPA: dTDP-4-dehydrorhamnose reductase [Pseudomonas sp.]|nr:dTDP-4-dehydrorhamnose reductase [Pseudomonas sp.]